MNQCIPLCHALKHMANDLPSLLKQAAALRTDGECANTGCFSSLFDR
ncbi:MAG: hypothetical protein ACYC1M_17065 [Armatimonadota bacterium]